MAEDKLTIIKNIKEYILQKDDVFNNWYIGITAKPRERLFNDHNVDEKNDAYICEEAFGSSIAREVEEYFVDTLGTDGGPGGGDSTAKYVYAYLKTTFTREKQ